MKQLYRETLLRMCETRELSDIAATALVGAAETSRQTFCNHFDDINDLISYPPINFMETYGTSIYATELVVEAYRYACDCKGFFCRPPFHSGQNNFRDTLIEHYRHVLRSEFVTADLEESERICRVAAIEQLVIGMVDVFLEWYRQQMSWSFDVLVLVQYDAAPAFIARRSIV